MQKKRDVRQEEMVLLELMLLTYCLLRDHGSIKVRHLVSGTVYFARTSE